MEINFKVTIEEGNLILAALSKLPYEVVVGLISKLQDQAKSQILTPGEPT